VRAIDRGAVCETGDLSYHAGGRNYHLASRSTRVRADSLDGFHNVHSLDNLSKHHVLAVEP
jgi:hypothetical protein